MYYYVCYVLWINPPLTLVFSLARPAKQKLNIRQKMYLQDKVSRISEIPFLLKEGEQ